MNLVLHPSSAERYTVPHQATAQPKPRKKEKNGPDPTASPGPNPASIPNNGQGRPPGAETAGGRRSLSPGFKSVSQLNSALPRTADSHFFSFSHLVLLHPLRLFHQTTLKDTHSLHPLTLHLVSTVNLHLAAQALPLFQHGDTLLPAAERVRPLFLRCSHQYTVSVEIRGAGPLLLPLKHIAPGITMDGPLPPIPHTTQTRLFLTQAPINHNHPHRDRDILHQVHRPA
jgi:hypothetical protein